MTTSEISYKYFNKARLFFKITLFAFIGAMFFSQVLKRSGIDQAIIDAIVGLPVIAAYVLVPIGFVFIIKSYKRKEPFHRYKILYLTGYVFFLLILLFFLIAIAGDIAVLLGSKST